MVEPALRQITSPSNHRCRRRRTEWRASNVKWKDDTHPPANVFPTIIFLVHIAREIALQDHRAEIVAEEAAHRELALLLVAQNWRVQIGGIETDPSHLPLAEAMAHRQINVDEVWITSNEGEARCRLNRTGRRLSPIRDAVLMDAPDDVRGRSPVVAGIAQRKPLIERGVGPRHRAMVLEISSNRVAKPPSIAEVPGQLAERRRVVHTGKVGAWIEG